MRILPFLPLFLLPICGKTQSAYFQQEVNYKIDVRLDDTLHILTGDLDLEYVNHSPDTLSFIYFHLWPNGYKDPSTAFAKQKLRTGSTRFYFSSDKEKGNMTGLDFRVDGAPATLDFQAADIAKLILPSPLIPGQRVRIRTPFRVKIPAAFSRLGHVGQSYQITQWYPKPAVYDRDGWHPMPYLDMGEFYSEFGSFEVSITLPSNYVVGATGSLEDPSEAAFLEQKAAADARYLTALPDQPVKAPDSFPASSPVRKTIHYRAGQVHDFAWFADKRFRVAKSAVTLPSGRKVDTWVMFTKAEEHLWKHAINYVDRAVKFYSDLVGEYPYPHATAVQSALGAGGGMEYPMITVIGLMGNAQDLDEVITHEVGHNWFYGILAFNERDHVWMDEGLNSYYDHRYTETYYGPPDANFLPEFLRGNNEMSIMELGYLYQARRRQDQAPETTSDEFQPINYWLGGYEKPARAFKMLEKYLGTDNYDRIMRAFYQEWQFRHPQPADLRQFLESHAEKDLSWLFDGLLYSNKHIDYALTGARNAGNQWTLDVVNRGEIAAPFPVASADSSAQVVWVDGFTGKQSVSIQDNHPSAFLIDPNRLTLDVNRKNNRIAAGGLFRKTPPVKFSLLGKTEDDRKTDIYYLPFYGWNAYDKSMVGLALHNQTLPYRKFEFSLLPLYATGSKSLVGSGRAVFHIWPQDGWLEGVDIGLKARKYHFNENKVLGYREDYLRFEPVVLLRIRNRPAAVFTSAVRFRSIFLGTEQAQFGANSEYLGQERNWTGIQELTFLGLGQNPLSPYKFEIALEHQRYTDAFDQKQQYLKASLDWTGKWAYKYKKYIRYRLFAGGFLQNSRRNAGAIFPGAFNLISSGSNDYRFDDFYFGRSEYAGFSAQQVTLRDGGFKTPVGPGYALGRSNSFIFALNLKADLPGKIPVRPYFDLGYFDNAMPTGSRDTFKDQLLWNAGLAVEFLNGRAGVYFPLFSAENLDNLLKERGNYFSRIGFRLELYGMTPRGLAEEVLLSGF